MELSDIKDKKYYYFVTYWQCHDIFTKVFEQKKDAEAFIDENMKSDFSLYSLIFGNLLTVKATKTQICYKIQDK